MCHINSIGGIIAAHGLIVMLDLVAAADGQAVDNPRDRDADFPENLDFFEIIATAELVEPVVEQEAVDAAADGPLGVGYADIPTQLVRVAHARPRPLIKRFRWPPA